VVRKGNKMEKRVNSLETELILLKSQMGTCQEGLSKEIEYLKKRKQELPPWLKNASLAVIFAIFGQTISVVWWASNISANTRFMQEQVDKNTMFVDSWPSKHREVMIALKEIQVENRNIKEMLKDVRSMQSSHNPE
jgi:hypothetical protein